MGFQKREGTSKVKIRWLSDAVIDLTEIRDYIASDKPDTARNVAVRIKNEISRLKEHPGIGRPGRVEGTRELVVSDLPYIIPYRVKKNAIEILRVLHGAREWPKKF